MNVATKRPQPRENLLPWHAAEQRGDTSHHPSTFQQAKAASGMPKGERGALIVLATQFVPREKHRRVKNDEIAEGQAQRVLCLRRYSMLNADQAREPDTVDALQPPAESPQAFIATIGADTRHGGCDALYNWKTDSVRLPEVPGFESPAFARRRPRTSSRTGPDLRQQQVKRSLRA